MSKLTDVFSRDVWRTRGSGVASPKSFCKLELQLRTSEDGFVELSICGVAGEVRTHKRDRYDEVVRKFKEELYIGHSFGQCVEAIEDFFPEMKPYMKWHLNGMHAECEHQEARGETWRTHAHAKCPECGYMLGHAWTKRTLPPEVVEFIRNHKFEEGSL